jgi:hypothetical protein
MNRDPQPLTRTGVRVEDGSDSEKGVVMERQSKYGKHLREVAQQARSMPRSFQRSVAVRQKTVPPPPTKTGSSDGRSKNGRK